MMMLQRNFYDYPRRFTTNQYDATRKTDGFHIVYEVKKKGSQETLGSIEVNMETNRIKECSGWRNANFYSAKEEIENYLRGWKLS